MEPVWRLYGREAERARIECIIGNDGHPAGVLIAGDAGVGKSRLLAECLGPERRAAWVVGNRSTRDFPLAAFTDWVPSPTLALESQAVLRETLSNFLGDLEGARPIVAVDDAHLLDPLSALLVQRITLGGHARVLMTVRTVAPLPEAIAALLHNGWVERIELAPLTERQVADLLEATLGHPFESHSLRRLLTVTGGSTRFLRELVESEIAGGGLVLANNRWYWSTLANVPTSITDLVLSRIHAAPSDLRELCDHLALYEPMELGTLSALTSGEAVDTCEAADLCRSERRPRDGSVWVRLAHPLYGEALREAMSPARKAELGARLTAAIVDRLDENAGDGEVLRCALLCAELGDPGYVDVIIRGARVAARLYDFEVSGRLARAAVRMGAENAAHLLEAGAHFRLGRVDVAADICRRILDTAADAGERIEARWLLACIEFWGLSDPDAGLARIGELAHDGTPPALQAFPKALESCFSFYAGEPALAGSQGAEVLADRAAPDGARLWAAAAVTITAGLRGRLDEARSSARIGHATIESLRGSGFLRLPVAYGEVLALGFAGELAEARRRAHALEECTRAAGGVEMSAAGSYFLGQVAWWEGDLNVAHHHLADALSELETFAPGVWEDQVLCAFAPTLACLGRTDEAKAAIDRLDAPDRHHYPGLGAFAALARAWVAALAGQTTRSAEHVRIACGRAVALDQPVVEVAILHSATRWGAPVDRKRLAALADRVQGPLAVAALAHAEALEVRDGRRLDEVAARWSAMGKLGSAADAAAQAALVHARADERGAAHASTSMAMEIGERTGARTPALAALVMPGQLTSREAQIAMLGARGRTNAEIASELCISVRTVEGHLNRIYAKLGLSGRRELPRSIGLEPTTAARD